MLYVFRGICGVGQGGIQSLSMVIVSDITTLQQRGKYQGILGAFVGLGNTLGPFICSAFIIHSSWRNFYHMLVPFFMVGAICIYYIVPGSQAPISKMEKFKNIDFVGFFFSTAGLILFLIPINGGGNTYAWDSPLVIAMLVVGGCCLIIFIFVEWKFAKLPMIPLSIFKNRSLSIILVQSFFFGSCFFPMPYFFSYYFELVRGWSTLITSCFTMLILLTQLVCSVITGLIISRTGHFIHVVRVAYVVSTLSTGLLLLWTPDTNAGGCAMILVLIGVGNGGIFQPTMVAAQSHAKLSERSVVISTRNVIRSLGGAIGLAVCSLIYSNTLVQRLNADSQLSLLTKAYIRANLYSKIDISSIASPQEQELFKSYLMSSIKNIFYLWFPTTLVSFVLTAFLQDHGLCCIDQLEQD